MQLSHPPAQTAVRLGLVTIGLGMLGFVRFLFRISQRSLSRFLVVSVVSV